MERRRCPVAKTSSACSSSGPGRSSSARRASSTTPASQACKALRSEGLEVVLVNSNPATIMTDPELADRTYVEPLTLEIRRSHHRARAPGRAAADRGRADGAEPRHGARQGRRARTLRGRAHRRLGRRDSTWPRTACNSATRCVRSASTCRRAATPGRLTRREELVKTTGFPTHHPAVVHPGRRRRRASRTTSKSSTTSCGAASP